ncbi:hypothetical protein HPB47_006078 [Ixodes persulcatus]|uniref:Uncharacterized protein n=1 Tax=Ixodes persulcatus TaxID=34615 RepID=A0AC60PBA3_IXOPE|nr:hypothetical protein HPB47_006078 [Ixodes persulcatus]
MPQLPRSGVLSTQPSLPSRLTATLATAVTALITIDWALAMVMLRTVTYNLHGLIPASCVCANRYDREAIVRCLGDEAGLKPSLTLGQLPSTPDELLKLDQKTKKTFTEDDLKRIYLCSAPQNDCFLCLCEKCPKMQSISLQSLHLDEDEEICFALWDAFELVKKVFVKSELKVGLVYVKEGQSTEEQILNNRTHSALFEEFLGVLGERVRLKATTHVDIINYLVLSTSYISLLRMKAYNSLEAHNYFTSGWVKSVTAMRLSSKRIVVLSEVNHSQRLREAPLKAWLLADADGSVITAHCTCVAEAGEACSHIGATLFAVETAVRLRNSRTCTKKENVWLPAHSPGTQYKRLRDIDFSSSKRKEKQMDGIHQRLNAEVVPPSHPVDKFPLRKLQSSAKYAYTDEGPEAGPSKWVHATEP